MAARAQMQRHSRFNRDYVDLRDAEAAQDRAIELLEQVLERNPNNDEARTTLGQMKAAREKFADVQQALLE